MPSILLVTANDTRDNTYGNVHEGCGTLRGGTPKTGIAMGCGATLFVPLALQLLAGRKKSLGRKLMHAMHLHQQVHRIAGAEARIFRQCREPC